MGTAGWTRDGSSHDFIGFFGVIFGPVYIHFLNSRTLKFIFFGACFQIIFLSISGSKFQRSGLPNQAFRIEDIAETTFDENCFL